MDVVFRSRQISPTVFAPSNGSDKHFVVVSPAFYAVPIERLRIEGGPRHKLPLLLYYLPRCRGLSRFSIMTMIVFALFVSEDGTWTSLSEWMVCVGSVIGIICFIKWRREIFYWLTQNFPSQCISCKKFLGWGIPKVNGIPTTHCPYCKTKL